MPCHGRAGEITGANLHVSGAALALELMAARHCKLQLGKDRSHDARRLTTHGRFGRLVVHPAGDAAHVGERQRPPRWHQPAAGAGAVGGAGAGGDGWTVV